MKKYFAAAAMTTLALAACNDEMIDEIADNNNNNNVPACADNSAVLADDVKVYPLLYTNFQNAHDVEITAADTSSMVVKSALLDAMQVELEPGNVISVWTAPEDIPFMRRIEAISKEGGNLRLHTRNVGLDEVLKEAHLEFDSQVYTNADELPRLADGTINDRFYLSEHDGVYHPTALWYHTQQEDARLRGRMLTRGAADEEVLALGYDRERTLIVEDMGQTRGSLDLGVNFKAEVSNMTRPIVVAEDTIASIGLQKAKFAFNGGLHARLDCSFWNGIERFEVGPYYSIEGNLKAGISMKSDLFDLKKEYTIAECQGFTSCFWVGPVPVVVSFTPSLVFNAELSGSAKGAIGAEVSFKGSHHTYACYERNDGWYLDEGGEDFHYDVKPYAGGSLGVEFQTGLYAKAAVSLYGVAGPTVSAGPYFKAAAEASVDYVKGDIAAKVSASVGLGGKVGAKLSIWRWSLAKWEMPFNLLEKEILNKTFSLEEWLKEIEAANEIMPTGDAEEWEAAKAEAEKEQRYQDDLDDIIGNHEQALRRFVKFMDPNYEFLPYEGWFDGHHDVIADWQVIKEQHVTFYDWELEFALWESEVKGNAELMQQISEHIAQNVQKKMELLEKVTLAQVKAVFNKCIYSDGFTITEALQAHRIPTDPVIVKDLENIRAEREKHLEYGVRTNTLNQEDNRDYHTPWFQAFGKN